MAKTTWKDIINKLNLFKTEVNKQHFHIDVAHRIFRILNEKTDHRSDLNTPTIGTYWGYEILQRFILEDLDLRLTAVFFELEYYSYLNLIELSEGNARTGNVTYVVDLITDSTDVKMGQDLEEWLDDNDFFKEALKDIWNDQISEVWSESGRLVTRKRKNLKIENYWNYEDYIYQLTIFDQDLNPVVVFLLGTFADYQVKAASRNKIIYNPQEEEEEDEQ